MNISNKKEMTYLTSWDVNVFLCLVTLGVPDDIATLWMKRIKKTHEDFSLKEAMTYWVSNSPTLVKQVPPHNEFNKFKFVIEDSDKIRLFTLVNYLTISTVKFRQEWRMRSIEDRQKKVIDWCKFGDNLGQFQHQGRLRIINHSSHYDNNYIKNLWKSWEAGA